MIMTMQAQSQKMNLSILNRDLDKKKGRSRGFKVLQNEIIKYNNSQDQQ